MKNGAVLQATAAAVTSAIPLRRELISDISGEIPSGEIPEGAILLRGCLDATVSSILSTGNTYVRPLSLANCHMELAASFGLPRFRSQFSGNQCSFRGTNTRDKAFSVMGSIWTNEEDT